MRKQLSALTETINKLNETIQNLHKENAKLKKKLNEKNNRKKIKMNSINKQTQLQTTPQIHRHHHNQYSQHRHNSQYTPARWM